MTTSKRQATVHGHELHCPNCGTVVPVEIPETTVTRYLAEQLRGGGQTNQAVAHLLEDVLPGESAGYFFTPVDQLAKKMDRDATRRAEQRSIRNVENRRGAKREANLKKLLDQTFAVGGGRRVKWGEATVADHEARLALLEVQRTGIAHTQSRHAWAIDRITRTPGAECLFDLKDAQLLAPSFDIPRPNQSLEIEPADR